MLPVAICFQSLEPIAGRNPQIIQDSRLIEQAQLAQSDRLDIGRQFPAAPPGPDQFGFRVREALRS